MEETLFTIMTVQQRNDQRLPTQEWTDPAHRVIAPNLGDRGMKHLHDLKNFIEITKEQCELLWQKFFVHSQTNCTHGPCCVRNKQCEERRKAGKRARLCTHGMSTVKKRMLAGSLLPVWDCIAPHMLNS